MPEDLITAVAGGSQIRSVPEALVLRILMRQDYRFFSDASSGFVANIFYCNPNWVRPNNLLVGELLFYLISQRKINGDNGQMGFVSINRLQDQLEQYGYVRSDILDAAQYVLAKELIEADSATTTAISQVASIKASASGWAHVRILASRGEYLVSLLPTTPINDDVLQARVFDLMQTESRFGNIMASQANGVIEDFHRYVRKQFEELKRHPGYAQSKLNGAQYLMSKIDEAVRFGTSSRAPAQLDWLDR
jgi:hypothetical protein